MTKWNAICSKIHVRATLEKGVTVSGDDAGDAMVNVHIQNAHLKYPIALVHMLWINLYEHKIVQMNHFAEPITHLTSCKFDQLTTAYKIRENRVKKRLNWNVSAQSTKICVPAKGFDLSKDYKLVIYYGPFELLFSKEFIVKVSDVPRMRTFCFEIYDWHLKLHNRSHFFHFRRLPRDPSGKSLVLLFSIDSFVISDAVRFVSFQYNVYGKIGSLLSGTGHTEIGSLPIQSAKNRWTPERVDGTQRENSVCSFHLVCFWFSSLRFQKKETTLWCKNLII